MDKTHDHAKTIEMYADDIAQQVADLMGKAPPVRRIRNSQLTSAILGAAGLALFLVGVEKVFATVPGWLSILLGMLFMSVAGVLFRKLS